MQFQTNPNMIRSLIPQVTKIAFVTGLLLGLVLGWIFSSIVGAVFRFGLLALLIIPLLLAIYFWWKVRNSKPGDGPTVVSWSAGSMPPVEDDIFDQLRRDQRRLDDVVIDFDDTDRERRS